VDGAPDGTEIIDAAGDFLIQRGEYADGLELYRAAVQRFRDVGVFHQGRGCCAAHKGEFREAVAASRRALAIEPDNQKFVNVRAMDLADELAQENQRLCNLKIAKRRRKKAG
jgi:Tfp pilus assembly protein PilF